MKAQASFCYVCGRKYEEGEEYLEVAVETSKEPNPEVYGPNTPLKRTWLIPFDATPEQIRMSHFQYQLGSWMRTSWVCLKCLDLLPLEWRQIFAVPSLKEWTPVERLDSGGDDSDTETWKVQRR